MSNAKGSIVVETQATWSKFARLAAHPAGLLSLHVSGNRLQRLPEGLGSAALLTSLSASSNPGLSLTRTEVEALLARLPNLAELNLYATGVPQDVAAYADRILRLRGD